MAKAEVKRTVRLQRLGLAKILDACARDGKLGWRSLWIATRNSILFTDEDKRGTMMVQLAFIATTSRDDKKYVAIYQRRERGHVGPRWVTGASALFGESLTAPDLIESEEALIDTFWKTAPFEKNGTVKIQPLGVGVSTRTKQAKGMPSDKRRHLFIIYEANLDAACSVCSQIADSSDETPNNVPENDTSYEDFFACMLPMSKATIALKGNLMELCAVDVLQHGVFVEKLDGPNRAFLRPGEIRGRSTGLIHRWFADGERAAWMLTLIATILVIGSWIPPLVRIVAAWWR